jgi:hypothetical protein
MVLVGGCSSSTAAGVDSGIAGRVLLGPTCPVQRNGQRCVRPYQASLTVYTAADHHRVKTFRSRRDGRFRVRLAPGRYSVEATRAGPPRSQPLVVNVHRHRFTHVTISFDSGIR